MKVLVFIASLIALTSARLSLFKVTFGVKQGCSDPPPSTANGRAFRLTALQSPVFYVCNSGYNLDGRKYNYCINGSWTSPVPPKCVGRDGGACEGLPSRPTNGRITYFRSGNEASYRCTAGYRLIGRRRVSCVDGAWTPRTPPSCVYSFCARKPCARYATCRNIGRTTYSCTCTKGYVGDGKVKCKRTCEPPRVDPIDLYNRHIDFSPKKDRYEEDESITYTCQVGYKPAKEESSLYTCIDGQFLNVGTDERNGTYLPNCKPVTCEAPTAPRNGRIEPRDQDTWAVGDVVRYFCDAGYLPFGAENATCQNNGRFDNGQVRCVAMCDPPSPPVNGRVEPFDRPFLLEGDQVKYFCDDGTVLQGSRSATCSNDGTLDSKPPTCQTITYTQEDED